MSNPFTTPEPPPEQQLRNVAHILLRYGVVKRQHNGRDKRPTHEADCAAIRDTGVQLAEMVLAYLWENGRERKANHELLKAAKEVLDGPAGHVDYIALDGLRRAVAKVEVVG